MTSPIDDYLAYQIAARHTPGALVHVERAGRTIVRRAVGRTRPDGDEPMHHGVRFRIASLTKPVVTVAALMQADEGRLDLDAPVGEFLPALRDLRMKGGEAPPRAPTVRDLMRHTSGMAYPGEIADAELRLRWTQAGFAPAMRGTRADAFIDRIAALPLVAPPGTAFRYGYSTDVLGCIVERVDGGRPLADVLQQRLFEPLGMRHSGFEIAAGEEPQLPSAHAEDTAWHAIVPGMGHRPEDTANGSMHSGGGGLLSTIDDYAAFARMLAHGGAHDGRVLLSPERVAEMARNQLPDGVDGPSGYTGSGFGFGLGLAVRLDWGAAAMPCTTGELTWSGISGTALFVQPKEHWFALMFASNMTSRMVARLEFRRAVGRL
jgi:CubicO group peptidase (beta-lactamase class C family)